MASLSKVLKDAFSYFIVKVLKRDKGKGVFLG
jgi:hypothetical protein